MLYQSLKYFFTRIGLSFCLFVGLGFSALYIIHELTFPNQAFDDSTIQWAMVVVSTFFGFFAYSMYGEQKFQNAFHALKNVGPKSNIEDVIQHFEALVRFTHSSYFLPGEGRRFRGLVVRKYADYLLSIGRQDPAALRIYLKAFLHNPVKSKFRAPLLTIMDQGADLKDDEIDLLLVMLKAEDFHDDVITNHLAAVFLRKQVFTGKTEPLFLAAVENGCPDAEAILRFVVPILLSHKRQDEIALRFYLESLPCHLEGDDVIREILCRSFCEGHFQGVDPVLQERCGQLFFALPPEAQQRLKAEVEATRISGRFKKVKLFNREDRQDLERLKVALGIEKSTLGLIADAFKWVVDLFKGLAKAITLKVIDGLVVFGRARLLVKLVTLAIICAWIVGGLSYLEWSEQRAKEIDAVQSPVEKPVVPAKVSVGREAKVHTIQVAAVTSSRQAERLVSTLKKKGVKGLYTIQAKRKSGGTWYKIRAGQFDTKEDARQYANQLIEAKAIKNYFVISFSRPTTAGGK
jgi:hypothetical protein